MPVFGEQDYPEDIRLKYRFLDLRRDAMHKNIVLRSKNNIIYKIRNDEIRFFGISNTNFDFFKS